MKDYDPYIEAFNIISNEENKKTINQFILITQNQPNINKEINENINNKENNPIQNNIQLNENDEIKNINNNINEEQSNQNIIKNNNESIEQSPNSLIGKKTKPDYDLDSIQISSVNNNYLNTNNNNVNKNSPIREYSSISILNNNDNKMVEEYDYGYSIILLNEGESGLIEDFLNEKQNESTTSDFYNFHLDEEKWIKILNHSILIHYERHIKDLKDEIEKRKKMQSTGNTQLMMPMNQMMFMNMNMNNGVNYQQMYLQNMNNLKAMPMQYSYNK